MRQNDLGHVVLALALVTAPACSRSGDKPAASNSRDDVATERAGHQTNDSAPESGRQPGRASRNEGATGTSGSINPNAEAAAEVGEDGAITMRIQAKYAGDDVVKGRNIDVDTEKGVVTLKGSVDSLHERDAAEQLARETDGVKRVVNELKVAAR